jgi:hypothetical protein
MNLSILSFGNKKDIEKATHASCFSCLCVFETSEIEEYVPEKDGLSSALCPSCGIDAVVPGIIEHEILVEWQNKMFRN